MTIGELLSKTADELEKLTAAEKMAYFEPYLKYVRPSNDKEISKPKIAKINKQEKAEQILALLEQQIKNKI